MAEIIRIPAFQDNYIWLLKGTERTAVVVDPGDAKPVLQSLKDNHLQLVAILVTHHHYDHCGGVAELLQHYKVPVYGGHHEPIPHLSVPLKEGDTVDLDTEFGMGLKFRILEIPGHTLGHIAYVSENSNDHITDEKKNSTEKMAIEKMAFTGDTLFTAGCGRLFEGTAEQMFHSLAKLKRLSADTKIYCGHEYTLANLQFALHIEPDNKDIQDRFKKVKELRSRGDATVPASLDSELKTNPFLRANDVSNFAELRKMKDEFRSK